MDSRFTRDQMAGKYIHTDKTAYNTREQQQKYRLEMVSNRLLGGLNMFYFIQTLAL